MSQTYLHFLTFAVPISFGMCYAFRINRTFGCYLVYESIASTGETLNDILRRDWDCVGLLRRPSFRSSRKSVTSQRRVCVGGGQSLDYLNHYSRSQILCTWTKTGQLLDMFFQSHWQILPQRQLRLLANRKVALVQCPRELLLSCSQGCLSPKTQNELGKYSSPQSTTSY